ncbi:MAG: hypothetical protein AAGA56_25400, partial [Myxococcota bacterium]
FMLGAAGGLSAVFGVPIDIRHIAFGSSHAAVAVFSAPELATFRTILLLSMSVAAIGLINFLVSFAITLAVAINARRLEGVNWRAQVRALAVLAARQPFSFFYLRPEKAPQSTDVASASSSDQRP